MVGSTIAFNGAVISELYILILNYKYGNLFNENNVFSKK